MDSLLNIALSVAAIALVGAVIYWRRKRQSKQDDVLDLTTPWTPGASLEASVHEPAPAPEPEPVPAAVIKTTAQKKAAAKKKSAAKKAPVKKKAAPKK